MENDDTMRIEELKQRIARDDYVVDHVAIADAIVERTLARHREAMARVHENVTPSRHLRLVHPDSLS